MQSKPPTSNAPAQMTEEEFRAWMIQGGEDESLGPFMRAPEKPRSNLIEQSDPQKKPAR